MKKLIIGLMVVVFALSFVFGVSVTAAEPTVGALCMATCDYSVGLLWVCCPVYKGNSGKVKWECSYGAPCGPIT